MNSTRNTKMPINSLPFGTYNANIAMLTKLSSSKPGVDKMYIHLRTEYLKYINIMLRVTNKVTDYPERQGC